MRAWKALTGSRMSKRDLRQGNVDLDALEGFKALSQMNYSTTLTAYFVLVAPSQNI